MIRAIILAGLLTLPLAPAFAGPIPIPIPACSGLTPSEVQALPNGGLPSGNLFKTSSSSSPAGSLTSFVDAGPYTVCSSGSSFLIPFYLSSAAQVLIGISEAGNVAGTFFSVSINGTTVLEQNAPLVPPNVSLLTNVAGGIDLLGIIQNYGTSGLSGDALTVGVTLESFIPSVPEPATFGLLGFGAAALVAFRRKRQPIR